MESKKKKTEKASPATEKGKKRVLKKCPKVAGPNSLTRLTADENNPRTISAKQLAALRGAMEKFGDLSGVVYNRRTKKLVGGHQRMKWFRTVAQDVVITKKYTKPTRTGTVAEGYIDVQGERYGYREVDWDKKTASTALLAANKHGGDWDDDLLQKTLESFDESDIVMAGFTNQALSTLQTKSSKADRNQAEYELTPELMEKYDYVVIFTKTDMEKAALHTILGIERQRGLKAGGAIGMGRVVPFPQFRKMVDPK